jgi:hypothetical protein
MSKMQDKLGWLGLGICIDYFIFRPVRLVRPILLVSLGFALGIAYSNWFGHILTAIVSK